MRKTLVGLGIIMSKEKPGTSHHFAESQFLQLGMSQTAMKYCKKKWM
jgi:hypothetical protein